MFRVCDLSTSNSNSFISPSSVGFEETRFLVLLLRGCSLWVESLLGAYSLLGFHEFNYFSELLQTVKRFYLGSYFWGDLIF